MRKLKLELLAVESFETTPSGRAPRGTVAAHAVPTFDSRVCPPTRDADCLYPSWDTACPAACFGETENTCASALDDCA
jgi:hypothetical protein